MGAPCTETGKERVREKMGEDKEERSGETGLWCDCVQMVNLPRRSR